MVAKRRKRSEMTMDKAIKAVAEFAANIKRWKESSEDFDYNIPNPNLNEIVIKILIDGKFGVAEDFFEGMRVLGGMKLPAKDSHG